MLRYMLDHWVAWATFAGYLVGTWFLAALARRLMKGAVLRWVSRTNTVLDDRLVASSAGPVRFMVLALGLSLALKSLSARLPGLDGSVEFGWAQKVVGALVTLAVTAMVNASLKAALDWYLHEMAASSKASWDEELLPVIRRVMSLLLYFIAISIILKNFGQDITALVTTAGVASLAIALAAQETLSNMLGGFVILVDRPFRVGDAVELADGKYAEVTEIGLRSTRFKLVDGTTLVVPNKDMANSRVTNLSIPSQPAAIRQTIGLSYETDVDAAKAALLDVLSAHPEVLKGPAPGVWFTRFGESGLELLYACWVVSYRERLRVADDLNREILRSLREKGIKVAYPQRNVHVHMQEPIGQ